ncbi:hypothetical protein [Salicibibacter kimchii]|uniref:Uncharacterized protein n=1 Tax=Salicibibacter kimchii TaxID=2099786 RepID=A0A345C0Z3_9BACI|nr:hypothetical protein [Salicibibacter kimchii]AXF56874.1 hypothetical protein DT065_13255 [Salicibibacter kimchii]
MTEKKENMSMQERIDYFYRQSGGPGNPEIDRILKEHLLNGKDHGVTGRKEELKDAFTEVFLSDHSTRSILMGVMKMRFAMKDQWEAYLNAKKQPDHERKKLKNMN